MVTAGAIVRVPHLHCRVAVINTDPRNNGTGPRRGSSGMPPEATGMYRLNVLSKNVLRWWGDFYGCRHSLWVYPARQWLWARHDICCVDARGDDARGDVTTGAQCRSTVSARSYAASRSCRLTTPTSAAAWRDATTGR